MKTANRKKTGSRRQMSESFVTAAFLSVSGGLQDAYTYFCRGRVYANAQTGNIVLLNDYLFHGNFPEAVHYLVPLISFMCGVAAAEVLRIRFQSARRLHWRQMILLIEIGLLLFVGFLPGSFRLSANALVSFACAMQVQAFRKVSGYAFASTMCIGNMRSGVDALCAFFHTKNRTALFKALHYFGIILLFGAGAGLGSLLISSLGLRTIFVSAGLLFVSFSLMFIRAEVEEHPEIQAEEAAIRADFKDIRREFSGIGQALKERQ